MFRIISLLAIVFSARAAFARADLMFSAGQREGAPPLEGQTLSWGAAVSQWNHVEADAEGALHHGVGETPIGSASEHVIAVLNGGDSSATQFAVDAPSAPYSFKGGQYPGEGGSCGDELPSYSACTLVVTHAPTELGYYAGQVHVTYHDANAEQSLDLRLGGYGISPAPQVAPEEAPAETTTPQ